MPQQATKGKKRVTPGSSRQPTNQLWAPEPGLGVPAAFQDWPARPLDGVIEDITLKQAKLRVGTNPPNGANPLLKAAPDEADEVAEAPAVDLDWCDPEYLATQIPFQRPTQVSPFQPVPAVLQTHHAPARPVYQPAPFQASTGIPGLPPWSPSPTPNPEPGPEPEHKNRKKKEPAQPTIGQPANIVPIEVLYADVRPGGKYHEGALPAVEYMVKHMFDLQTPENSVQMEKHFKIFTLHVAAAVVDTVKSKFSRTPVGTGARLFDQIMTDGLDVKKGLKVAHAVANNGGHKKAVKVVGKMLKTVNTLADPSKFKPAKRSKKK